jgi:hypothetical protein
MFERGGVFISFAAGHEASVAVSSAAAPDLLMATRLGAGNPVDDKGAAGFSFLAALNSPNETDREDGCPEHSGGTGWDGLSPRLSLLLHYRPLPRQTPLRGYAARPDSAPADMPRPMTSSTPSFSRCGNASATARCRSEPSRWFAHHLDRTRNGHAPALVSGPPNRLGLNSRRRCSPAPTR